MRTIFCPIYLDDRAVLGGNDGAEAMEAPVNDPDIRVQVGLRIKTLREKAGFSQEDLAFRADMSRSYLGDVENGKYALTDVKIKNIADALGVSMQECFTDEMFRR